jgi:phage shock protein E
VSITVTVTIVVVVVALFVVSRVLAQRRYAQVLEQARQALERGAVVLDARSAMEFSGGHHEGAVNYPPGDAAKAAKKLRDRKRPVVVYCASGSRSRRLAEALRQEGFERVLDVGTLANMRGLPAGRAPRR